MKPNVRERVKASPAWIDLPSLDLNQSLDWTALFGLERAQNGVEIDLGAGDGDFIAARAAAHPERGFLGVERLLGRALKIARKAEVQGLNNLKALRLESWYTLQYLAAPGSVAMIHLMFPDPWPKNRHAGNRVVQPTFAAAVAQALQPEGEFRFTTDHEAYFQQASEILDAEAGLIRGEVWDHSTDATTDFQALWEAEGRSTYRACWVKKAV